MRVFHDFCPRRMVNNCGWATTTLSPILPSDGGNFCYFYFITTFVLFLCLGESHNLSSGCTICHGILLSFDIHPAEIADIIVQKKSDLMSLWFFSPAKMRRMGGCVYRQKEADSWWAEERTLLPSILASSFALCFPDFLELGNPCLGVSLKNINGSGMPPNHGAQAFYHTDPLFHPQTK